MHVSPNLNLHRFSLAVVSQPSPVLNNAGTSPSLILQAADPSIAHPYPKNG
jgi:diacylglycerol diphosphate phosphatase / phosphatidate phosphatase